MFEPHGICLNWNHTLILMHSISDGAIAAAYFAISTTLAVLKMRGRLDDTVTGAFAIPFALFIFLCGTTHVFDILVIWWPWYDMQLLDKVMTAATSLTIALFLIPTLWNILLESKRYQRRVTDVSDSGKQQRRR